MPDSNRIIFELPDGVKWDALRGAKRAVFVSLKTKMAGFAESIAGKTNRRGPRRIATATFQEDVFILLNTGPDGIQAF
ncbi:MAG: hypothetical protein JNL22_07860 [Bacteroidales bacterium]|nr:hypothetical protein [Bacteroidales bacterium]